MAGRNETHNIGAFVDSEDEEQESPFSSPQKYYDLVSKSLHTYDKDMAEKARRTAERAAATKRPQPRRRRPADASLQASDFEDGSNAEINPDEPVKPRLNRVLFRPRDEPKATADKVRREAAQVSSRRAYDQRWLTIMQDSDEDFTTCAREREQSLDDLFVSQPPPDLISSDEHSSTSKPAELSRARKALPTKSATKIPSGKIGSIRQKAKDLKLSLFEAGLANEDPAVSACTNLINVLDTAGGNGGPRDSHSTGKRKRVSITTSGRGSTSKWKVERRDQARLEAERSSKRKQGVSDEQFPEDVRSSQDSDDSDNENENEGVTIQRQKMIADRERRSEGAALKTAYPASQPQAKVPISSRFEKPEELKKKMMPHPANNGTSLGRFDKHGGRSINKTVGGRKPQPAPSRSLLDRLTVTLDEDEDLPSVQELNGSGELRLNERNLHQQSRQARTINERLEDEASERMKRANTFVDDQVGHVEQDGYDSQALEIDSDSDLFGESADIGF